MGLAGQPVEIGLLTATHRHATFTGKIEKLLHAVIDGTIKHKQFEGLPAAAQPLANRVKPVEIIGHGVDLPLNCDTEPQQDGHNPAIPATLIKIFILPVKIAWHVFYENYV
jgi:hypothetical protein